MRDKVRRVVEQEQWNRKKKRGNIGRRGRYRWLE